MSPSSRLAIFSSCLVHRDFAEAIQEPRGSVRCREPHRLTKPLFRAGCGEEGTRTPDLLLAKQALYQLSYSPEPCVANRVRVLGFEPRTSALSELRSSQLSY